MASVASYPEGERLKEVRRTYGSLGLRASIFGTFTRLDVAQDFDRGTAVELATQTSLLGINLLAEHAQYFNFSSERVRQTADKLLSESNARLDSSVPAWWVVPSIPISLTAGFKRRESGRLSTDLSNRLSMFLFGINASHNLKWALQDGGSSPSVSNGDGSVLLNWRINGLSLRGGWDYTIHPVNEPTSTSLTADYSFTRDISARLTVDKQINASRLATYSAGLNYRSRYFALGLTGTYSDDDKFSITTSLTLSLGKKPRDGGWVVRSDRLATTGSVSARVYLDNNQNNKFDEGDEPLPHVKFRPGGRDLETDENGVAFITGLSSNRPTNVILNKRTLEDPFWAVLNEGFEVVTRPGRPAMLEFPVLPTGEVDGTVFLLKDGAETAISNAQLQLVNAEGKVIQEEKSSFDGFYLFSMVPLGKYTLRVSPEQVQRLNLKTPLVQAIDLKADEPFMSGMDITVEPAPKVEKKSRKIVPLQSIQFLLKGEVGGTVFLIKDSADTSISNAQLQLIDSTGKVAHEVKSSFDGIFLFTGVPLGKYILRVSPEDVQRLHLKLPPEQEVILNAEKRVLSGMDITVEPATGKEK